MLSLETQWSPLSVGVSFGEEARSGSVETQVTARETASFADTVKPAPLTGETLLIF